MSDHDRESSLCARERSRDRDRDPCRDHQVASLAAGSASARPWSSREPRPFCYFYCLCLVKQFIISLNILILIQELFEFKIKFSLV